MTFAVPMVPPRTAQLAARQIARVERSRAVFSFDGINIATLEGQKNKGNAVSFRPNAAEKATRPSSGLCVLGRVQGARLWAPGNARSGPRGTSVASGPYIMVNNPYTTVNKPDFSPDAVVQEMQSHIRTLALPAVPGESVKAAVSRAARRAGLSYLQARRLWYGTWTEIPAYVADGIRATVAAAEASEIESLQARLDVLRRAWQSKEPAE